MYMFIIIRIRIIELVVNDYPTIDIEHRWSINGINEFS